MPTYKDESKNTWYCKFYYKDWTGKRKQKKKEGFKTQREAKEFEREFIRNSKDDCTISFAKLSELYLNDCDKRLKQTSIKSKKTIIERWIRPYFESLSIDQIKPNTIRAWQNEMISYRNKYGKSLSSRYLHTINTQLISIFNYAKRYYGLKENPALLCGHIGRVKSNTMQFWTLEEYKRFIQTQDDITFKLIFELLFWTGMRSGELLALTLNDFDIESKTVSINKTYSRIDKKDIITSPKTHKGNRVISIPEFICDELLEYVNKLYDYQPNERLFINIFRRTYTKVFKNGCSECGVKCIRIHDLRHSHASLLIEQGYSPLIIAERLGHENINTTLQIYSHLYPNKQGEVADKLDELNK